MVIFIAEIENKLAFLTEDESWHCTKVLRKKAGEQVRLIDGKGNFYEATLSLISEKKCVAEITGGPFAETKREYFLHLAIAPTKQMDRIEWLVEKAVEIGIDEISLVICKNSERTVAKTDRLKKIAESAVKQSLQATLPKINEPIVFKELLKSGNAGQRIIAHCIDGANKTGINEVTFKHLSTLALVGPEGDFTSAEVEQSLQAGFKPVSLGANRLRTETAGLYICQAASILSM